MASRRLKANSPDATDLHLGGVNIDPWPTPTSPGLSAQAERGVTAALRISSPPRRRGALRRRYESPLRPRGRRGRVRWGHGRVRLSNRWYPSFIFLLEELSRPN